MCFRRKIPNVHVYLSYVGNYLDSLPTSNEVLDGLSKADHELLMKKNKTSLLLLEDLIKLFVWPIEQSCGPIPSGEVGGVGPKPPKEIEGVEIPNIHVLLGYVVKFLKNIPDLMKLNPGISDWQEFNDRLNRCKGALNVCHLILYPPKGPKKCGKLVVGIGGS